MLGLGMSLTVAPLTTTVMRSVSDSHSGLASGVNNAMTRIANVFANAIFGALAVLFFTGTLHRHVDGLRLDPATKKIVMAQTADLGNAHVPDNLPQTDRPAVAAALRGGFINAYQKILRLAAGLAFIAAVIGLASIRNRSSPPAAAP
jgi:hypothetical protein